MNLCVSYMFSLFFCAAVCRTVEYLLSVSYKNALLISFTFVFDCMLHENGLFGTALRAEDSRTFLL